MNVRLPSPALVVATVAVVAGLGGSAVAASSLITGKQIKDGTIRAADINKKTRDGLRGKTGATGPAGVAGAAGPAGPAGEKGAPGENGAPGEKGEPGVQGSPGDGGGAGPRGPAGPSGPKGDKGDTGDKGDKGDKGDRGDVGPSDGFVFRRDTATGSVSASLPPGRYVVQAKLNVFATNLNPGLSVVCTLATEGGADAATAIADGSGRIAQTLVLVAAHASTATAAVTLSCNPASIAFFSPTISAVRVGAVTTGQL